MTLPSYSNANRAEFGFLALGLLAAVLLGLLIPTVPLLPLALIIVGPVLLLIGAIWPLAAVLVTVALAFEIIPTGLVMGIGSFRPHELMIGYLAVVAVGRALLRHEAIFAPLGRFRWPLLYLVLCVAMSVVYAHFFAHNEFILAELRNFAVWWLLLPTVLLVVRTDADQRLLIHGMIVLALAMSCIVIVQSVFDIRILTEARVEALDNSANADVTRSIAGGVTYLMVFALYYFLSMIARRKGSFLLVGLAVLLLVGGLAVTFGRGVWIATSAGLLLATFINQGVRGVVITGFTGALFVAGMLGLGSVVKPRLVDALIDRAMGVGEELERGGSFAWRGLENRAALAVLEARPLTGVGLGGEYKKTISTRGSFKNETWYIHNAYMAYAVKMGVHAALFPFWMMFAFAATAADALRRASSDSRSLQAALIGAFIVPVITSYTQPEWIAGSGVVAFSLLIAGLLVSAQDRRHEASNVPR